MTDRLPRIVANLLRHIPDPPPPVARPAGSFAGLRAGQRITGGAPGDAWEVLATDSLGADIGIVGGGLVPRRITDRAWHTTWSRIRTPRKQKGTTT